MKKIICLKDSLNFVKITDGTLSYYGGNQAWYEWGNRKKNLIAKNGACGTVAAANITAYLARHHKKYASLYPYSQYRLSDFILHMNEMYHYISPYHIGKKPLGVWPVSRVAKGTERFSRDRGAKLNAVWKNTSFNLEHIVEYIAEGLEKNSPVAMLIGTNGYSNVPVYYFNGTSSLETIWMHWVTITELTIEKKQNEIPYTAKVKVSTWGGWAELDLNYFLKEYIYQGLLYFE